MAGNSPGLTGLELKYWRQVLRLSQNNAAQALDLSRKCYQELERGARFDDGSPTTIDRRTELACRHLLADATGNLASGFGAKWRRATGR